MIAIWNYVSRTNPDHTPLSIDLFGENITSFELAELVDGLLTYPDIVKHVHMSFSQITDKTGVKIARYVATSSTIETLDLRSNHLDMKTYLAIAAALRANSTMQDLYLFGNRRVDKFRVNTAFVNTLRLNPIVAVATTWMLYNPNNGLSDSIYLKNAADRATPPSMLEFLLYVHLDMEKIKTRIH